MSGAAQAGCVLTALCPQPQRGARSHVTGMISPVTMGQSSATPKTLAHTQGDLLLLGFGCTMPLPFPWDTQGFSEPVATWLQGAGLGIP